MAGQTTLTGEGAFDFVTRDAINDMFTDLYGGFILSLGRLIYLNPVNGDDTKIGESPSTAVQTLSRAYALATAGKNDTIVLLGDGSTTATARVDAAFTWAKNATHLIGVSSGVNISNRSRIAPTSSTTAFANFFTVSASGCLFKNIQWFHGFATGTTAAICLTISGGRNLFADCHIAGLGDDEAAQSATSRSLKISTTGENTFLRCTIGIDTVTRTVANASVEFAGGCPRNQFIECIFPFMTSSADVLGIKVAATAGSDRFQTFVRCQFLNAVKSTSTAMTGLANLAASMGGMLVFTYSTCVGITKWGNDATSLAQCYVDGAPPTAATSGLAVNPT
ncbi:MAG: hypothetical protein NUW22_07535 [Acidobacteria bacterium]|nr:hypothetical protein [Acidobacteriota bacterium]